MAVSAGEAAKAALASKRMDRVFMSFPLGW
jgi:hypothetical protein